ncbi:peptidoglycan DD-metalloendopeptidase family protein [Flavobacterium cucumis]|uniref:Peptidase family M23 n=1 Tax=Flavobacterium cucumis TaxID=416016 RepID=A0A1M7ZTD9_9FLAO|nr:peptidoglycan DD-metalloendopeptidase family protein [Flavobacterium cucumis]SHO72030.1 Peptidase family M23 [Flavobacterium cucumis]
MYNEIEKLFQAQKDIKVISTEIDYSDYIALDLSVANVELSNHNLETAKDYEKFIQNYLDKNKAKIAFGGYLETRNLYKRSTVFKNTNSDERNIHIGLDLWINDSASIYAALDGTIHSFQNNNALGDYGPTVILAHEIDGIKFHTLYGHLSEVSLIGKKVGDVVKKGEQIASLGLPPINGDYAPHLHFQIIIDMEGKTGDYPGVCSEKTLPFYKSNCPDPNILLKIN